MSIAYARVSSHNQRDDLAIQVALLESFCAAKGWSHETIQDLGSGLNSQKRGLKALIKRIYQGEVSRLVLTHRDRLLRFGAELIFQLCEQSGTEVVIINATDEPCTFEEELVADVLELITVFYARLYGRRSRKNRLLLDRLNEAVNHA